MAKGNSQQAKHLFEAHGPVVEGVLASDLLSKRRNKYLLINVISRRARDLNRGERARVEIPEPHSPTELAIAEVQAGKLRLIRRQPKTVLVSMIKNE